MTQPISQPTVQKDIRLHVAKLAEVMDEELIQAMDDLAEWWFIEKPVGGFPKPPVEAK